jgi:hypothetical protein
MVTLNGHNVTLQVHCFVCVCVCVCVILDLFAELWKATIGFIMYCVYRHGTILFPLEGLCYILELKFY